MCTAMDSYQMKKLSQMYDETKTDVDINAYVQEKKLLMRSNRQYMEAARKLREKTKENFRAIRKELEKGKKLNLSLPDEVKKLMRGR